MKQACSRFWDGLVALAHGETSSEAQAHVMTCESCQVELNRLRDGVAAMKSGFFDAPKDLIQQAKAVFPRVAAVQARLLRTTLVSAGARGGSSFQAVYEYDGGEARVLYEPDGLRWRVMGTFSGDGLHAVGSDEDSGKFELVVSKLEEAEVRLVGLGKEIVIPAPEAPEP